MMKAEITFFYKDLLKAKAVSKAVSPDNLDTPEGLFVQAVNKGNYVVALVRYESENLLTFWSTIDDLLSCISVAEKAFIATDCAQSNIRKR